MTLDPHFITAVAALVTAIAALITALSAPRSKD
jgi:hypothetical protein